MSIRAIPRSAVSGTIKLVRLPLDTAMSLLPDDGSDRRPQAGLALDRIDAFVRDVAGVALRDEQLRDDAARRLLAAEERARALRLRNAAEQTAEQADAELAERREQAGKQREQAAEAAREQRAAAERTRESRTRRAGKAQAQRKAASRKAQAKVQEVVDEQATAARREQLKREAEALDERAEALAAQSEAQRLQDEASRRKAARKAT